jgi:site-specific DNA-methyltransferase (adenine-specific)
MQINDVSVSQIKPYENNPRVNDGAVDAVAASIKEFGFKVPIIIDKDNIIVCGHTRLKAAKMLGLKTVPAIMADDLTPEQVKGLRIADNQTASLAEWDTALLQAEIDELENLGFDMDLLGFKEGELEELLNRVNFTPGTIDDQGKLDELSPKMIKCPKCGEEFDLRQY